MRVPYTWLREYCDPGVPAEELAERLVMTGTEVERIDVVGPPAPDNFVVGKVTEAVQHPDADRLRVCTVEVGEDGPRTIVCGAPNVAAGQTVAVALPGARMPGGEKLRKAKLRGVASEGMILAADELEIGDDHDGTLVLDDALAAGTPLAEVIPLAEPVLEIEVTPNRSDCFGVFGVAREVHAVTGAPLSAEPWAEDAAATGEGDAEDFAKVTVEVPDLCPRFTARVFKDVKIGPSPLWLQERLAAAGMRPISNVVDITNYVMLLTAQPLHAYDLEKLPGGELIVRTARPGEKMTTLDGVERELDAETVLVCDRDQPTGIAALMGGQVSEVSDQTTDVLLEVANWNGANVLRTSRRLSLRSEASARFEKQLHPALTMRAQAIASRLLVELAGATLVPGTIDVAAPAPEPHTLRLRGARVTAHPRDGDPAGRPGRLPGAARLRGRGRRRGPPGHRAARPLLRRDPGDRPDRGGRPPPRLRPLPADDAARGRRGQGRPAEPHPAAAAAGRGRAARPRLRPDRRLELHRPRRGRAPADRGARPARRTDPGRQPALRRGRGDADDPARLAARRRRPQPGAGARGGGAVRGRRGLPARHPARRAAARWRATSPATRPPRRPSRTATARSPSGRWCRSPGAAAASRPTSSR